MLKYNGVGSLTRDDSRGIALIEYDDTNNPKAKGSFALTGRNPLKSFLKSQALRARNISEPTGSKDFLKVFL
jgi:hypothetical protein